MQPSTGNSGGGLFDIAGNLIGIVNANLGRYRRSPDLPFRPTPLDIAKELMKGLYFRPSQTRFVLFEVNDTQDYMQYWRYNRYISDYGVYIAESESPTSR